MDAQGQPDFPAPRAFQGLRSQHPSRNLELAARVPVDRERRQQRRALQKVHSQGGCVGEGPQEHSDRNGQRQLPPQQGTQAAMQGPRPRSALPATQQQ